MGKECREGRKAAKKRKTQCEIDSIKEARGPSPQELGRAVEDGTWQTALIRRVQELERTQ